MLDDSDGNDTEETREYRDWKHDLNSLQKYGQKLVEEWENQNPNSPRDYPTVRWLTKNGYSHLRYILQEKHDMGACPKNIAG